MKASLTVALVIAGVCLAGRAEAQTVVVGPQAGSLALLPGARVSVPIVADLSGSGGASLGSATAQLTWRPAVLAFLGAGGGALGQPVVNADSAGGSLRFAVANPAGATGQPVLVNVTFAVVGAAGANDTLHLQLQELTRAGSFADLLPSGVATASHLCVSTGDLGDLNNDGSVTSFDALLMITSAVGLPIVPYTVVNGDVDGDGQVTTRDALIALSYAIALPVDGFRVGRMNPGSCSVQTAASVQIAPKLASVAVGDLFPLTATVRDSGGALVQGVDLVWTSADTTVVKADATGHLVGTKAGSARVFAFASPGLRDSATVTVDSLRHVWWVNPAVAALNGGVELGSTSYPFASIGQALGRAAAGDSVMIAPATYGEAVRFAHPLTLVGDSTAAGVTTIRNPTGPGIAVDSLPGGGLVRIDRVRILDSQGGVVVHGNGTGVVSLARLGVTQSTAAGITARNVALVILDQVVVDGAVQLGIGMDSVPQVRLHVVGVDAVSASGLSSPRPIGMGVTGADSLVADSLQVGTAGVRVDSTSVASFHWFRALGTAGPALAARVATSFALDSGDVNGTGTYDLARGDTVPAVTLILAGGARARITGSAIRNSARMPLYVSGGDSVLVSGVTVQYAQPSLGAQGAAAFQGMRRVAVEFSSFLDNGDAGVEVSNPAGPLLVSVDSSAFRGTVLQAATVTRLDVSRSSFQNSTRPFVRASQVGTVSLRRVDLGGLTAPQVITTDGGPSAVSLAAVDSAAVDSVIIHDNLFGAMDCTDCRAVAMARSQFLRNGTYGGTLAVGQIANVALVGGQKASFQGVTVDGSGTYGLFLSAPGSGSRTVVDSSVFAGQKNHIYASRTLSGASADTLVVTRSAFHGRNVASGAGVYAYFVNSRFVFALSGSTFDSVTASAVAVSGPVQGTIFANRFVASGGVAFYAYYAGPVVFDSNVVFGCSYGPGTVQLSSGVVTLHQTSARVTRNVLSGCPWALWSQDGSLTQQLALVGNTITSDSAFPGEVVHIGDSYDSLVVVGNTVVGGRGIGIHLVGAYNGIAAARVDSNSVRGVLGNGLVVEGNFTGPAPQMTYNVIADNDTDGIRTLVPLAASANTVVRNRRYGLYANSVGSTGFRSANFVGNVRYGVWNDNPGYNVYADSSYFGSPTGPSCDSVICNTAAGDSITAGVTFAPYSGSLVPGTPPIPAPLGAPPFRAAASPSAIAPARSPAQPVARPRPSASVQPRRARP